MRTNETAIFGAIGTASAFFAREFIEASGLYISFACGVCTLLVILPKAIKTVKNFRSLLK